MGSLEGSARKDVMLGKGAFDIFIKRAATKARVAGDRNWSAARR